MAIDLPDWVKEIAPVLYAGAGVAIKQGWDYWSKRKFNQDAEKSKDNEDFKQWLIERIDKLETKVTDCEKKHQTESTERQEAILGMTRALAIAETRIEQLAGTQGKLVEATMNGQWMSKAVVEATKHNELEGK